MTSAPRGPRAHSLFPREHGAAMELMFPLLTAFWLARPTWSAIALGVASICVFVAHEPLMVLTGRRGQARRREDGPAARRLAIGLALAAGALTLSAAILGPLAAILALAVPVALAVPALALAARGEERTLGTELLAMLALTSVALPIALASGADPESALAVIAAWAITFTLGTLAARGVLYQAKDHGRGLRLSTALAAITVLASLLVAALEPSIARYALAPLAPALASLAVAASAPTPKQMKRLGLVLTAASVITLIFLVA